MSVEQFGWQDVVVRPRSRAPWIAGAILLVAAFLLRSAQFGNPINGLDEQFYLLVGDRMWHGALPYVDLWDRKPVGLFVLFAGIRALGGEGVIQAQIVASLFAVVTAGIVTAWAKRAVGWIPATMAGVAYLTMLQALWGGTTQTPVFYNLPIAIAAWLVSDWRPERGLGRALVAMLLAGVAVQIKTTAAIQGAFLGLWLLWQLRLDWRLIPLALAAAAPTLAAGGFYATIGHFHDWWFATVQSQFLKSGTTGTAATVRLREFAGLLGPVLAIGLVGLARATRFFRTWGSTTLFLAGWLAAALTEALVIGGFWPHYALPVAVPAAILAARAFAAPRWGKWAFVVIAAFPAIDAIVLDRITAIDERAIAAATLAAIPADVKTRGLFIYEGPVAYYQLTQAKLVTRYAFTDHLRSSAEAPALGEDASVALRAALGHQPGTIITLDPSLWRERNRANDAILAAYLTAHYQMVARFPHRHYSTGREWLIVWRFVG